ncbi:MAG: EamA family transporter RarD [Actinobacteria bacterium]|nr:EamA family transporter RarD [Actinomycetota bacterium]
MSDVTKAEATAPTTESVDAKGVLIALAAYLLWGSFPLYFQLLVPAGPLEIIGHRVLWSFVFCLLGVVAWRTLPEFRAVLRTPRLRTGLMLAGVLVTVNWLVYVWGVLNDHIVDAALGYFINPLFTVTLAVLVLHERLRPAQWVAVGIGAVAVIVIAVGHGQVPWVALALATSFGLYGLAKNRVGGKVSPLVGLTVETSALAPIALGYLLWLQVTGAGTFTGHGGAHTALLASAGIVTAIPLLLFAEAAARIPLSMIGLIQYLTPTIQFALGVWVNHEVMPLPRWIGFGLVWVALIVMTADSLRAARQRPILVEPELD